MLLLWYFASNSSEYFFICIGTFTLNKEPLFALTSLHLIKKIRIKSHICHSRKLQLHFQFKFSVSR